MKTIQPQFTHDCDKCTFIGIIDGKDAYVCVSSVVLRRGNEGPDYDSIPIEMVLPDTPFAVALRMGVRKNG